jgi:hypothetical protein
MPAPFGGKTVQFAQRIAEWGREAIRMTLNSLA